MAYNVLFSKRIIVDGDMALVSLTSSVVEIRNQDNIGVQLHWIGSPNGSFDVQISSNHMQDNNGNVTAAGNWISVPILPTINAVGSADDAYIDLYQMSAQYIRIVYTKSSGTGTLNAYLVGKGV